MDIDIGYWIFFKQRQRWRRWRSVEICGDEGGGQAPPRHFDLPLREEQYISTHAESVVGT